MASLSVLKCRFRIFLYILFCSFLVAACEDHYGLIPYCFGVCSLLLQAVCVCEGDLWVRGE